MLIDEILAELGRGRKSMEQQIASITEIAEKSNNVLLQLENQALKPPSTKAESTRAVATPYNYRKETLQALTRIVEQFPCLLDADCKDASIVDSPERSAPNLEEFLKTNRQRSEFLCSNVRKLLLLSDSVTQMKADMLHQDKEECHIPIDEVDE